MATAVKRTGRPPRGRAEVSDAVLDAAERLFARQGPQATTLREVADEAGVTYSLINRHFGTKDVLVAALLDRYAERWRPRLGDDTPVADRLAMLLGDGTEQSGYLRLLAWYLLVGDASQHAAQAVLDRLLPPEPTAADRAQVAVALSLTFGWRFFHPFITAALHVDASEAGDVSAIVAQTLRRLAAD